MVANDTSNKRMQVTLSAQTAVRLEELCKEMGVKKSAVIALAIEHYYQTRKAQ